MIKQLGSLKECYFTELNSAGFFLILMLIPFYSFAQFSSSDVRLSQISTGGSTIIVSGNLEPVSGTIALPLSEMKYKGSPYLNEEFELCDILNKGIKIGSLYYRYNAYNEEIQVKKKLYEDNSSALRRDVNVSILTEGNELIFHEFLNKNDLLCRGYLFRLVKGEYSLFKRQNVKFSEGKKAATSFDKPVPPKFTKFKAYFLQVSNGEIVEINLKKKVFLKSISPKAKERLNNWKEFKDKKMKNELDLIDMINFLNE